MSRNDFTEATCTHLLQALEERYPAEFLAMMHCGNEIELRKSTLDADRFLAVHHLRCLLKAGKIDKETYDANKNRLMGKIESVRRGINSLTRSFTLSQAAAELLQHPQLRPLFSASSWRKLTTGRLYEVSGLCFNVRYKFTPQRSFQLASWILQEAHSQFSLLVTETLESSEVPFSLQARTCGWDDLANAVREKSHPWHTLPGGAQAALARVRYRPNRERCLNPLDCPDSQAWSFSKVHP